MHTETPLGHRLFRIVDVWNSLSEAIVKSSSVNSFKNNLCNADLSKFLTVV